MQKPNRSPIEGSFFWLFQHRANINIVPIKVAREAHQCFGHADFESSMPTMKDGHFIVWLLCYN